MSNWYRNPRKPDKTFDEALEDVNADNMPASPPPNLPPDVSLPLDAEGVDVGISLAKNELRKYAQLSAASKLPIFSPTELVKLVDSLARAADALRAEPVVIPKAVSELTLAELDEHIARLERMGAK